MEDYWAEEVKIPHYESVDNGQSPTSGFYTHNSKEKIDAAIENLKNETELYIQLYCLIRLFVTGRIDRTTFERNNSGKVLFETYDRLRNVLYGFQLADHPFVPVLYRIEKEVWRLFENAPDGNFTEGDKVKSIISGQIDQFRKNTDLIRNQAIKECDDIANRNLEGDILSGVRNNIDNISTDSDDIIKNMLSMVLKIEADNDKQPL